MNYYYARGRFNSDRESEAALRVNNCGYYRDLCDSIEIHRPSGRGDYHLLCCINGAITVEEEVLGAGEVYLFLPHQKQIYAYQPAPDSFYFWVHFTGREAPTLLKTAGLTQGKHGVSTRLSDMETILRLMTPEQGWKTPADDALAAGLLCSLLMLISDGYAPPAPLASAIRRLESLEEPVSVEELADMYKMSKGHFIRLFRSYFGVTPYRYRIEKQIEVARMLLSYSHLTVSGVAARVGFDDPLYFSRLFRKYVGASPLEYRKRG